MASAPRRTGALALEELKASKEIFKLLVESTPDYAIFLLSPDGIVQTWNSGARQLKGYEESEVIGRHVSLFYPLEDRNRPARELEIALRDGRFEEEGWRVRKDGSRFWASVILTALYDTEGLLTGFSKVTRDVTDRRRADDALRGQAAELERRVEQRTLQLQSVVDQLESFTYSVSHDLRSPLRGLQGLAMALLEDYGDRLDERGREYARTIVDTAHGLADLIQDLLTYSRLGGTEMFLMRIDPRLALHEALAMLRVEIEETAGQIFILGDFPQTLAHTQTLVQVWANLVGNALKYVAPGVRPEIHIAAEWRESFVRLVVRDNGIGIAPEYHERIFKVFERLHGSETCPGTGVGLAIVAKGVSSMGGRVGVESELGKGSSFWFELHGD
ncbi:MAG TPA: ATP-binding protein [Thermoanaerobaculia bacterium]|jgi:PAS domain S-box-containing protein|nr:ATP-binding protein [Thermoanaerobaculia bacterium]